MKILLIFALCLISGPVSCVDVIGYSEGSVIINCRHKQYSGSPEYFCKKAAQQCVYVDQTQNTWRSKDTVYLHSIPRSTVVIYRNLSVQDAGSYQCGKTGVWNHDLNLRVIENSCCSGSKTVTGNLGETLTISCSYPEQYEKYVKTFHKQAGRYFTELVDTEDSLKGRFSISQNKRSKVVSVRIRDVREEDGGVYYCGAWKGGESVSYDSLYSEIQLQVADEDECEINPCEVNSVCHNTVGSYFCTCEPGFQSRIPHFTATTGQCQDEDECEINPCGVNSVCHNTVGSYFCTCEPGFQSRTPNLTANTDQCEDEDECEINPCGVNSVCHNTVGSYFCTCEPGFQSRTPNLTATTDQCEDEDECEINPCGVNSVCHNTVGSYFCTCEPGFQSRTPNLTANTDQCEDEDECEINPCGVNSVCHNTVGSYFCTCEPGFQSRTPNLTATTDQCEDEDECEINPCGVNSVCHNTVGSYFCTCEPGFQSRTPNLTANTDQCEDEDECEINPCGVNSVCHNTVGSYFCTCEPGFQSRTPNLTATTDQCEDEDECEINPCGVNSVCHNTVGSYFCTCEPGFQSRTPNLTANTDQCEDEDECEINPCGVNSVCHNTVGSYFCTCEPGFQSRNPNLTATTDQCEDEDECEINPCGVNSVCHNTVGSYFCTCEPGFQSRNPNLTATTDQCEDINECLTSNPCSKNMTCKNTIGSYTCECLPGYQISTESDTCTGLNIMVPEDCKLNLTPECAKKVFSQIDNITDQVSSLKEVEDTLKLLTEQHDRLFVGEPLESSFNSLVKATDKLLSTLVKTVETSSSVSISLKTIEARVFEVGPKNSLKKITELHTPDAKMEIDLVGISANHMNQGHAAVAFMSYTNMSNSSLFTKTTNSSLLMMMSTVVSATLPRTKNTTLTKPVQFTLKHKEKLNPNRTLSCVYWTGSDWVTDGCTLIHSNENYSVCSCTHLSTFALIMQIKQSQSAPYLEFIAMVVVPLGLMFLVLALFTFALCWKNPRVINTARINLCISLLLAHLLFLLTQSLLNLIEPLKLACAALAGMLHFLFLSAFVWMFVEALMLFVAVINLSRPKSKQKAGLNWKLLTVAGYTVALVVVGVSAGVVPDGHGSEQCWLKEDKGFFWSFLGPVSFILASNTILFCLIAVSLGASLARLNSQVSQIRQTRTLFFKTTAQFIIFGCPWLLGIFSSNNVVLHIIFLILSSQQGTFIFIVHCVLNKEVRQEYKKLLGGYCMASYNVASVTEVQNIHELTPDLHTT